MLDLRPYFRRPISTLAAVAADPLESWIWFSDQYAAHREGHTPPDLYKPADDWAGRLNALLGLSPASGAALEFWGLWPKVIRELEAKAFRLVRRASRAGTM